MATIRQLPSGKWQAQVRLSGMKPQSKSFSSKDQALAWGDLLEGALRTERTVAIECSVKALGEAYLSTVSEKSRHVHSWRLKPLAQHFHGWVIDTIELKHLSAYERQRSKEVASSTVRAELEFLKRVIKFARMNGHTKSEFNPFLDFKMPAPGKPRSRVITETEYSRILAEISPKVQPVVMLSWETAMRRSEVLQVTRKSINWDARTLHLSETKNGYAREVPLSSRAMRALRLASQLTDEEVLFNMQPKTVSRAFKRACERLNIEGACFHSLRHTAVTRYASRGLSTQQLQVISGHRDTRSLSRYTHLKAQDVLHLMD